MQVPDIKLVKYNPGTRQENIYRLFTGNNISTNGKKIPLLYVENNYKKVLVTVTKPIYEKKYLTSASKTSLYYDYSVMLSKIYPIYIQESAGSFENIKNLNSGKSNFAIVT